MTPATPRRAPRTAPRGRAGFTLIELVVTLGIMALVLGILLYALGRFRGSQAQTQCLGNLRQLMEATLMYATQHDGYGPDEASLYTWDYLLMPYIKDARLFACPRDEVAFDQFGTSYQVRDYISTDPEHPQRSFRGKRLLEARPASLIIIYEIFEGWHDRDTRNAVMLNGTARPFSSEEFEENIALEVLQ